MGLLSSGLAVYPAGHASDLRLQPGALPLHLRRDLRNDSQYLQRSRRAVGNHRAARRVGAFLLAVQDHFFVLLCQPSRAARGAVRDELLGGAFDGYRRACDHRAHILSHHRHARLRAACRLSELLWGQHAELPLLLRLRGSAVDHRRAACRHACGLRDSQLHSCTFVFRRKGTAYQFCLRHDRLVVDRLERHAPCLPAEPALLCTLARSFYAVCPPAGRHARL